MFPIHAKCVTFDAGWPKEREMAREKLEIGRVYTIRQMSVGQSSSTLEFYEVKGHWNVVFFEAAGWDATLEDLFDFDGEPPGGNDPEAQ